MDRLETSKADLQADVDQQLCNLRDVIAQKETKIASVSWQMSFILCAFTLFIKLIASKCT